MSRSIRHAKHRLSQTSPVRSVVTGERGFSLMEALVASVIAIIAILGMAYTFGLGRGLVFRYEIARAALGIVQTRMEFLSTLPPTSDSLRVGYASASTAFVYEGQNAGSESWRVTAHDDPTLPGPVNLRRVQAVVRWEAGGLRDSIDLVRMFPLP